MTLPVSFETRLTAISWLEQIGKANVLQPFGLRRRNVDRYEIRPMHSSQQVGMTVDECIRYELPQGQSRGVKRNGAVDTCRQLLADCPGISKADFVERAVTLGVNRATASIQFGRLQK